MDVKLPKLGEGAEAGVVVSIAVKEGDQINKGQTIIELENEKAVAAIPSSAAGTVTRINVKAGDRISVGHVILALDGAAGSSTAEAKPEPKKAAASAAAPKARKAELAPEPGIEEMEESDEETAATAADQAGFAPPASPSVRKLARDIGLDLRKIQGSEDGGRIVLADIKHYIQKLQRLAARGRSSGSAPAPAAESKPPVERIDFAQWGPVTTKPLSPIRQTISRRMVENKVSIPHVTQFDDADITALTELRKKYAAAYEAKGTRLTLTSFALKAVANTLKKFPIFNSSLDEAVNELVFKQYIHIGLAVDTEQGLLVPVVRDADKKDLLQLSKDVQELAEKARARKVSLEEMKGGTFTISNQGGIGGAHFTPIINKPEVAILGLGRGSLKAVVKDKKIEARLMMPIGLSYDHRVIDGGEAARFTVELVAAFENFKEEDVKL
jgi:pyruvate dehydrogenase E2 component (dihydrolipoamide acetyltransferase)